MRRGSFSEAAEQTPGGLFAIHLGASARPVFMKALVLLFSFKGDVILGNSLTIL